MKKSEMKPLMEVATAARRESLTLELLPSEAFYLWGILDAVLAGVPVHLDATDGRAQIGWVHERLVRRVLDNPLFKLPESE